MFSVRKNIISFTSENGIRLIETYKTNGEVHFFKEYLDGTPPQTISVSTERLFVAETERVGGMIFDNAGEKLLFSIDQSELELIAQIE